MSYLEIQNVSKSYGAQAVIPGIDLQVEAGEFLCLVGPSGSGKSTLLRMIAGLEEISGGNIRVAGEDISDADPSDRDMAMVFQSYALYPHMSVADNITFALRMRGMDKAQINGRLAQSIKMLKLEGLENRKPKDLSGGQRQRVAMGRCIVRQPKLFLFDEPLSNLDAKLRSQTRHQIRHLHNELHATSIFVTHDQVEAMTMADRIALLNFGEIQQVGSPEELYLRPRNRFTAGFLGSPEMNFFSGQLRMDGGLSLDGPARIDLPVSEATRAAIAARCRPGQDVDLGVRPEHLVLAPEATPGSFNLNVQTVEWLGAEAYAFGQMQGHEVGLRLPNERANGARLPQANEVLAVTVMSDTWHLFDRETGENLALPG